MAKLTTPLCSRFHARGDVGFRVKPTPNTNPTRPPSANPTVRRAGGLTFQEMVGAVAAGRWPPVLSHPFSRQWCERPWCSASAFIGFEDAFCVFKRPSQGNLPMINLAGGRWRLSRSRHSLSRLDFHHPRGVLKNRDTNPGNVDRSLQFPPAFHPPSANPTVCRAVGRAA